MMYIHVYFLVVNFHAVFKQPGIIASDHAHQPKHLLDIFTFSKNQNNFNV